MDRIVETHQFGPHRVEVCDQTDDEGREYVVVVIDGVQATDPPLESLPSLEDVVRIYANWHAATGLDA
jgi:hypothetical protein